MMTILLTKAMMDMMTIRIALCNIVIISHLLFCMMWLCYHITALSSSLSSSSSCL